MPPCRPPAIALVLAIAGPALVACTARIALKDYPRSRIDRPYTLPAGVDTWTTAATGSYVRDNYGSNTLVPVPWPLNWGLSLSDTWTLELNPVPLAISHELLRTDDHLLGARLSWSLGFGSEGVLLGPSLRMDHRIRLGRTWAWGTAVSGGITRWTNQPSWGWSVGLGTGPIWQVTDTVALQPVVGLGAPSLRGWFRPTRHEPGHGALRDVEAELEQLAVNARRAPERIRERHGAHEIRKLQADRWSTHSPATGLPGPESAEALPVPANHRLRPHDMNYFAPSCPPTREPGNFIYISDKVDIDD